MPGWTGLDFAFHLVKDFIVPPLPSHISKALPDPYIHTPHKLLSLTSHYTSFPSSRVALTLCSSKSVPSLPLSSLFKSHLHWCFPCHMVLNSTLINPSPRTSHPLPSFTASRIDSIYECVSYLYWNVTL